MVTAVEDSGRVVARKRSRNEADALRLQHEAAVLRSIRHPGVVELVDCERDADGVVLTTELVGTHSLETLTSVTVERAAGLVAAVAETVADLHDAGVVHGRIDPTHVLVGRDGRPVLCGFAGGGRADTTPPPGPPNMPGFCDPAVSSESTLAPTVDVYGLGSLLRWLLVDSDGDGEPIPERRYALSRLRSPWTGFHRRALLTLADRATDDVASRRPPARRLARDLLDTVPSAALVDDVAPTHRTSGVVKSGRIPKVLMLGIAAAACIVGATVFRDRGEAASATTAQEGPAVASTSTSSAPSTSTTARARDDAPRCATNGLTAEDLDADGCGDPFHIEDGRIIVVGTKRFTAGEPGDRVAIGDWDCTGKATVALLRPSSGEVFVFGTWATALADVSVAPRTTVLGAVDLQTRTNGKGCTSLVALRADGTEEEIT